MIEDLLAHRNFVRGVVGRMLQDESRADDVEQEVWLAALRNPPAEDRGLKAWLARVAHNVVRKSFRAEYRRVRRERAAASSEQVVSSPSDAVERAARGQEIMSLVLALEEPLRTTVLLTYFDGLTSDEVGARFGITGAAVRKRLKRALALLRAKLRENQGEDLRSFLLAALPLATIHPAVTAPDPARLQEAPAGGLASGPGWLPALVAGALAVGLGGLLWVAGPAQETGPPPARTPEPAAIVASGSAASANASQPREAALTLRGIVRSAGGRPLRDVRIDLAGSRDGAPPFQSARTRTDGTFRCEAAGAGWIRVAVRKEGYLPWSAVVDPLRDERLEITLTRGAILRARVLTGARVPVAGTFVRAEHCVRRGVAGMWKAERFSPVGSGTTDGDGRVVLGTAPEGEICISVDDERFAPARSTLNVFGAEPVEHEILLTHGGTVQGIVLDPAGLPAAGARVYVVGSRRPTTVSGPDGRYSLTKCPEGEMRILAELKGVGHAFFGSSVGWGQLVPLIVRADDDFGGIDLHLRAFSRVAGRLVDESGTPAPGVEVIGSIQPIGESVRTRSGDDGRFELQTCSLARGWSLHLSFASPDCVVGPVEIGGLAPAEVRDLGEVAVTRTGAVRGVVTERDGSALRHGRVVFLPGGEQVDVAADGTFELRGLAPGPIEVLAEAAGSPPRKSLPVRVDVAAAREARVNLEVRPTVQLSGFVLTPDRRPQPGVLVGARIDADDSEGTLRLARTGDDGAFAFFEMPDAEYYVGLATQPAPAGAAIDERIAFRGDWMSVTVAGEHEPPAETGPSLLADPAPHHVSGAAGDLVLVAAIRGGVASGRVLAKETASPPPFFDLSLVRYEENLPRVTESRMVTDRAGGFTEVLPTGTWAVEVRAAGYAVYRTPVFRMEDGSNVDLGTLRLEKGGSLLGTVVDARGDPVPFAQIHIVGSNWRVHTSRPFTDIDGGFRVRHVAPGRYTIFAVSPQHPLGVASNLAVATGATTRSEIRLPESIRVTLRVVDDLGRPVEGATLSATIPSLFPLSTTMLAGFQPAGWGPDRTGPDGVIVKPHAPPGPIRVSVRAEGFEHWTRWFVLRPDGPTEIEARLVRAEDGR